MSEIPPVPETPTRHPLATGVRLVLAAGALGMMAGGVVLIGEGIYHIGASVVGLFKQAASTGMTGLIMKATDELLFGVVLMIFGANIAFGFCLDAEKAVVYRIPSFMRTSTIQELKANFCLVIVVFLIVDFATDIISDANKLDVSLLYFPAAIVLIALALWLLPHAEFSSPKLRDHHDAS